MCLDLSPLNKVLFFCIVLSLNFSMSDTALFSWILWGFVVVVSPSDFRDKVV